ncbi:DUF1206 domain-containing protein [Longimicrobium sp.]|uniref:DUF1206 domain-containing protein n=1 Tax=Longimicrobium sp. TaxID=2029185 RepID=UPI002E326CAD|nr:DUF1206 domain-containing protein [Longimicrobium sp.]HEX6036928.1 DUF1206 domain-containing protein [Longimicrobium sp.]
MALFDAPARQVQHHARRAAAETAPWVQRLARLGYAAKGVVYIIIGYVAADAAFSPAEQVQGSRGALNTILQQPFGKVLLGIVALGLAGYVLWKAVQAVMDPEHKGSDAKGMGARIGYGISGVLYAGLTLEAVRMLRGHGGGQGDGAQHWTGMVMDKPFGRWLVGLVGLGIAGYGVYQLVRAFKSDLTKKLNLEGSAVATRRRVVALGKAGMAARGVVFLIIGWLVLQSARHYNASEAQGLEGALVKLREAPAGPWVLAAVALGLIAYGIFQLVKARYRTIRAA